MVSSKKHPHIDTPSESDLERIISGIHPSQRELYVDVHRLALEALPGIRYSVDCEDAAIGYGAHQFGYDGWGMAAVTPYKGWVSVGFLRGALLDDPERMLEGSGALVRHVKLRSPEELAAKREALRRLLESAAVAGPSSERFYHGTRADLKPGDLVGPGYRSNYGSQKQANHVYFSATLDAAIWGAELAQGEGRGRIYFVEPTGPFEDDPNLTDKKFPGNPTKSYRTREPLRVTGEVTDWEGHSPEALKAMKDGLEELKRLGVEAIDD